MSTPAELKAQINELETELIAANETAATAPVEIAELEAAEAAAEEAVAPLVSPKPPVAQRIMPIGQFMTPQEGTDRK